MADDYVEFIHRTGTKNFSLNIDFGVFQTNPWRMLGDQPMEFSPVEDITPFCPMPTPAMQTPTMTRPTVQSRAQRTSYHASSHG